MCQRSTSDQTHLPLQDVFVHGNNGLLHAYPGFRILILTTSHHAETTTDDAILHSSIRSSGAQNVPPLTRDVEPESASAASSTMHSRDRMRRPVWAPSPLTSSADEAVTGCVCSRENAVTTWSTTAPRARLTAMSRIIARGISRLQPCLSLDPFSALLPLRGSTVRYRLQPALLLSPWNG